MLLSTNTGGTQRKLGLEKTVKLLADAGFDAADISLDMFAVDNGYLQNVADYKETAHGLRKIGDGLGIVFNQAHATFPTSYSDDTRTDTAVESIKREIEFASICGVKNIIVHPKQHLYYFAENNKEILKKLNEEFYGELLPTAENFGVNIATENMWQNSKFDKHIIESTCASPEEFCEYVDVQNNPRMVACLDIGHAVLVGRRPEDMIYALGKKRLKALHIHDNDGKQDQHVFPYSPWCHSVDWSAVLKALADIDYDGDFTYETTAAYKYADEDTALSLFRYAHDLGRSMIKELEGYKAQNGGK